MHDCRLSRHPHHLWFCGHHGAPPSGSPSVFDLHAVNHLVSVTLQGGFDGRVISRGKEETYYGPTGQIQWHPADDREHTYLLHAPTGWRTFVVELPSEHLGTIPHEEGAGPGGEFHRLLMGDDPVLRSCLLRLSAGNSARGDDADTRIDETARRLVLRLHELGGGLPPDWHDDASVFERRTLDHLVAHIDEHLRLAPSLSDMALLVGLSPSHFAKKFRQSTGLSLHRFVNRRRINRAIETLKSSRESLTSLALDLGFSSQSHFTRLFSDLTGMSPAKYRKSHRVVMG